MYQKEKKNSMSYIISIKNNRFKTISDHFIFYKCSKIEINKLSRQKFSKQIFSKYLKYQKKVLKHKKSQFYSKKNQESTKK